jgi:hypothetical protein
MLKLVMLFTCVICTGACTSIQAPAGIKGSLVELPCKGIQYISIKHSNVENTILALANEYDNNNARTGKSIYAKLQYLLGEQPPVITETQRAEIDFGCFPDCILTQDAIAFSKGFSTANPRVILRGLTGQQDITPNDLAGHANVGGQRRIEIDCLDSSQRLLITEFERGAKPKYYVGANSLKSITGLEDMRTLGDGFDAYGYHRYALIQNGQVLRIDAEHAAAVMVPELNWISAVVKQVDAASQDEILDFSIVSDLFVIKKKDAIRFFTRAGSSYTIKTFSPVRVSPSGHQRFDYFSERITREPQSLILEGKRFGMEQASDHAVLLPLNSTTIGILDRDYYRMAVFQAK